MKVSKIKPLELTNREKTVRVLKSAAVFETPLEVPNIIMGGKRMRASKARRLKILLESASVVPGWVQPGDANGYMTGDRVMYQRKVWRSLVDHNIQAPGEDGWEECA